MMKWLDGLQIMYWEKQAACKLEFRELGEAAEMGILMLCEENWFGKLSRPLPTEKYREEGKWLSIQIIQEMGISEKKIQDKKKQKFSFFVKKLKKILLYCYFFLISCFPSFLGVIFVIFLFQHIFTKT